MSRSESYYRSSEPLTNFLSSYTDLYLYFLTKKLKRRCNAELISLCSSISLDHLAQSTVTGLPAETLGPAEVLPPQTTPDQDFGSEVSGISSSFVLLLSVCLVLSIIIVIVLTGFTDIFRGECEIKIMLSSVDVRL